MCTTRKNLQLDNTNLLWYIGKFEAPKTVINELHWIIADNTFI